MSSVINNGNGEGLSTVGLEDTHCSLNELMITVYSNKCCIVMVALVTLYGVKIGLSLFNVWASTIYCMVVPLVKSTLT